MELLRATPKQDCPFPTSTITQRRKTDKSVFAFKVNFVHIGQELSYGMLLKRYIKKKVHR